MDLTIVILGGTGDLTRKKLIPAIYKLQSGGKLDDLAVIGVGRRDLRTDELLSHSKAFIENINEETWGAFRERFYYFRSDFYDDNRFKNLGDFVRSVERKHRLRGKRLFYLATMPRHFKTIISRLHEYKVVRKGDDRDKLIFEKPFGQDLASAKEVNSSIQKVFEEGQIYRIDHYLGKELVQNVTTLRFTNMVLQPLWNKDYVDHFQIVLSESIGYRRARRIL